MVGAGKEDVTPPLHVPYLGFEPERLRPFQGVHDRLYARAMVLSSRGKAMALLSVDALGLSRNLLGPGRDFIQEVRSEIQERAGIPPHRICLAATHAHSTPETYGITRIWERKEWAEWIQALKALLVQTVHSAVQDLCLAEIHTSSTRLQGFTRNRREALGGTKSTHPVDDEVFLLIAQRRSRPPVLLSHFACHPVIVQVQPLVSADYPGESASLVERNLGPGSVCLFFQGAAGDINPIMNDSRKWEDVEKFGQALGAKILEAYSKIELGKPMEHEPLSCSIRTCSLPGRKGTESIQAECQVFRIGSVALVAVPGELFCEIGLRIKKKSPSQRAAVISCANGCVGYLSPRSAWHQGGYEVEEGPWCTVGPGGAEILQKNAVHQLRKLWQTGPSASEGGHS